MLRKDIFASSFPRNASIPIFLRSPESLTMNSTFRPLKAALVALADPVKRSALPPFSIIISFAWSPEKSESPSPSLRESSSTSSGFSEAVSMKKKREFWHSFLRVLLFNSSSESGLEITRFSFPPKTRLWRTPGETKGDMIRTLLCCFCFGNLV